MHSPSPVAEWAPPPGSSAHYALRLAPPEQREPLMAWHALCREWQRLAWQHRDPGAAATTLAWWRTELVRAFAERPHHPLLAAWAPRAQAVGLGPEVALPLLEACEWDLRQHRVLDRAGLEHRLRQAWGGPMGAAAGLLVGHADAEVHAWAQALGRACGLSQLIRHVGRDARLGRIVVPVSELQADGVKAADLLRGAAPWGYSPAFSRLMHRFAAEARAGFDEARQRRPLRHRQALHPLLAWGDLHEALLGALARHDFAVLHQQVSLTPLRKVWVTMRTPWRHRH